MAAQESTYSNRLFQPFAKVLIEQYSVPAAALEPALSQGPDERVSVSEAHERLRVALAVTKDPALGLKAGRAMAYGDGGVLDYAVCSAPTIGQSIEVAARYIRLLNDALELRAVLDGTRAMMQLQSHVVLPAAAEDFLMSAMFASVMRNMVSQGIAVECWLTQSAPANPSEHIQAFAPVVVRFSSPSRGFVFPSAHLGTPLHNADPKLHALITSYAEQMLDGMPSAHSFSGRVRELVIKQLAGGQASVESIARQLHMSARTLARRLLTEGTSFTDLKDDVRKQVALRYVGERELSLSEVAFRVGFAQVAAFHRAFRRWTAQTPLAYRTLKRQESRQAFTQPIVPPKPLKPVPSGTRE